MSEPEKLGDILDRLMPGLRKKYERGKLLALIQRIEEISGEMLDLDEGLAAVQLNATAAMLREMRDIPTTEG